MKKIYLAIPLLAMAMTACNPSEIDGGSEWGALSADQVQASATPIQVDGKNGNKIHVVNTSPVVSAWDVDQLIENTTHTVATEGEVYVTKIGTNVIRCLTTNIGGTPTTKEVTVEVDTISYITPAISERLCIGKEGAPKYFGKGYSASKIILEQTIDKVSGKPGNSITIKSNPNPALCTFKWGSGTMTTNVGKIVNYELDVEHDLTVEFLDATGKKETVSLGKFTAAAFSDLPEGIKLLTGYDPVEAPTATKTWELVPANNWGNGGNNDKKPSWWTTTVEGQGGSNGTLTFDFPNSMLTKVIFDEGNSAGDKSGSGKFSLDFSTTDESKNILFTLKTTEPGNIIYPIMINQGDYHPTVYDVTVISENELVLRAQHTNDATWEGCFWVFQAVKK